MRDYGKVASTFWTGKTGRQLRDSRDAQVVALYLLTGPMSNMIGLYHLPVAMIADQTGMRFEGASKALRRVCETGFARFDAGLEHVFVPEMAAYQIGEPLHEKDKRVTGIISLWQTYSKSEFYLDFHKRYRSSFHLPEPKPLRSPFEAPSKPGSGTGAGTGEINTAPPKAATCSISIPEELDTPEFREAWERWKADRRARKIRKYTEDSERTALKKLVPHGPAVAMEMIDTSIANGWQGLFPPKAAVGFQSHDDRVADVLFGGQ